MSVGDVKGYRRRLKQLERAGHAPKRTHISVADSIARQKVQVERLTKRAPKKAG